MCYEWGENGSYHENEALAMLDLQLVLQTVDECLPSKPRFEFFGGEPLLYPDIWQVIKRIREGGCELAFPTNGTLLEKYAQQLVDNAPTRLWVSLDGPELINDSQRGRGVFKRVLRGLAALSTIKKATGSRYPELGITYIVTPANFQTVETFFLEHIDLAMLSCVSIELQSYTTSEQGEAYATVLKQKFSVEQTPCANAYVRDPAIFAGIDFVSLAQQMQNVATACAQRSIVFHSQPNTMTVENIRHYFSANWQQLIDRKHRCAMPWLAAEISARGELSTCHSFYDLSLGNIHEQSLLTLWRGERLQQVRQHLRHELFSICTACCRYYDSDLHHG
jgi:radical SAM protein with 4Fe4S-binding SPASM domain